MKPDFTDNELSLIGQCVLQTIRTLRAASDRILIEDATQSIETTILRCRTILNKLAEADHEK